MTANVPCCKEPRAERKVLIPLSYEHVTEMRLAPRKRDEPLYDLQTAVHAIDCECAALGLIVVSWAILVQSICPIGYFSTATEQISRGILGITVLSASSKPSASQILDIEPYHRHSMEGGS